MKEINTICGMVQNAIGILDDFTAGLSTKDEVEDVIKEMGYQWLKAVEIENVLIDRYKKEHRLTDKDWKAFIPFFAKAEIKAGKKWEREFGAE